MTDQLSGGAAAPARIMGSAVAAAEGAIGSQVDRLVTVAVSTLIGVVFGASRERDRKEVTEYYDRMTAIVDNSSLPRDQQELQAAYRPYPAPMSPQEQVKQDIRDANNLIEQSIQTLEAAQEKTMCGVCKTDIGDAITAVREKTDGVRDASEKALAIRDLKDRGMLPPEVTWEDLTPDGRLFVINTVRTDKGLPPIDKYEGDGNGSKKGRGGASRAKKADGGTRKQAGTKKAGNTAVRGKGGAKGSRK